MKCSCRSHIARSPQVSDHSSCQCNPPDQLCHDSSAEQPLCLQQRQPSAGEAPTSPAPVTCPPQHSLPHNRMQRMQLQPAAPTLSSPGEGGAGDLLWRGIVLVAHEACAARTITASAFLAAPTSAAGRIHHLSHCCRRHNPCLADACATLACMRLPLCLIVATPLICVPLLQEQYPRG